MCTPNARWQDKTVDIKCAFPVCFFLEPRDCSTSLYIFHCRSAISQKLKSCTEDSYREHGEALLALPSTDFCRRYVSFMVPTKSSWGPFFVLIYSPCVDFPFVCCCWDLKKMHISHFHVLSPSCSLFFLSSCFHVLNICTELCLRRSDWLPACLKY